MEQCKNQEGNLNILEVNENKQDHDKSMRQCDKSSKRKICSAKYLYNKNSEMLEKTSR